MESEPEREIENMITVLKPDRMLSPTGGEVLFSELSGSVSIDIEVNLMDIKRIIANVFDADSFSQVDMSDKEAMEFLANAVNGGLEIDDAFEENEFTDITDSREDLSENGITRVPPVHDHEN